jgi:hypothetical protein
MEEVVDPKFIKGTHGNTPRPHVDELLNWWAHAHGAAMPPAPPS